MGRKGCLAVIVLAVALLGGLGAFGWSWWTSSSIEKDTAFVVPSGASLTSVASDLEVSRLVEADRLFGSGLGWIDAHLMAAVLLNRGLSLWTRDRRLNEVAMRHGRSAQLHH